MYALQADLLHGEEVSSTGWDPKAKTNLTRDLSKTNQTSFRDGTCRPYQALHTAVEGPDTRSMDIGNGSRVRYIIRDDPSTDSNPSHEVLSPRVGGDHQGVTGTSAEGGDPSSHYLRRLCEQHFHCSQKQWESEAHPQPKEAEHLCNIRTFQNGGCQMCQGLAKSERVHVQAGSKRCIPHSAGPDVTPDFLEIPVAREGVSVHRSSLWAGFRTPSVYQADETGLGMSESQGNSSGCLPRRFSDNRKDHIRSRSSLPGYKTADGDIGVCSQRGEVRAESSSTDRVPWVYDQLMLDDNLFAIPKDKEHQTEMLQSLEGPSNDCEEVVSGDRDACGHKVSSAPCTSPLSSPATVEDRRTSPPPLLRVYSDSELSEHSGPTVVGHSSQSPQWETNCTAPSESDNRVGRVQHRMGGSLQLTQDGRPVVLFRGYSPHQCEGVISVISGSPDICTRPTGDPCPSEDRQRDCSLLHQSLGRHTLQYSDESYLRDVELVLTEGNLPVSGTSTRETEPDCRSGVTVQSRQLRVEAGSNHFPADNEDSRSMPRRSFCLETNCTTSRLHELETRSRVSSDRCYESGLVTGKVLCFPTILPNREMPGQSTTGEGSGVSTDCPIVANSTVVPSTALSDDSRTCTASKLSNTVVESQQGTSSSSNSAISETSRMASIRSSLQGQGISQEASEIILASWRKNTETAYSCNWRRWQVWCRERCVDPLCASIGQILDFLTSQFAEGKQFRTLNSYRSAISMTHPPIDGVVIGKHPLISRFMRGVFNNRPPQPRYNFTWDVAKVLSHIRSLGTNDTLPMKELTHKLATILALANASRSSEIHALDVKYMTVSHTGVTFTLKKLTKSSRPGKQCSLFYPSLQQDPLLCPVLTLRNYLSRTAKYRKDQSTNLFLAVVKPYRPVHKSTIARWIKTLIHEAGIDGQFSAHSIRGAATTAAVMQGMSVGDIMKVADWASDTTFKRFYYRPMERPSANMSLLTSLTTE